MAVNLRNYETQAVLSLYMGIFAALTALAGVGLLARNFDTQNFWVSYSSESLYIPALGLTLFVSLAVGTVGFFVALNSAGQKRNKRSALSWKSFFLNAAALTLALAAGLFFYLTRFQG